MHYHDFPGAPTPAERIKNRINTIISMTLICVVSMAVLIMFLSI